MLEYPADTAEFKGYQLLKKLTLISSEKDVWLGKDPEGNGCVLCYAKSTAAAGGLQREHNILEHLGPHDNLIGLIELIENWGGQANLWCLVIELVEPLGYDMLEAFNQQAVLAGEKSVPLHQIKHYVIQIASALERLHSKGVAHRDMKVDNVLITGAHQVKLIDFGMAIGPEGMSADGCLTGRYHAPELADCLGDARADLYGIGIIIYSLCSGSMPLTAEFKNESIRGQLEDHLRAKNVTGEALIATQNLLHHDPERRWTIAQVKDWAGRPLLSRTLSGAASPFQRWSSHCGEIPKVFGLNLLANELDGKTIGELDLFRRSSMLILLIIRNGLVRRAPEDIISVPVMGTVLKKNDWMCFGVGVDVKIDLNEQKHVIEDILTIPHDETPVDDVVENCAKDARYTGLYPFLPEFDMFTLPPHCANGILGPDRDGQNGLNLRKLFGINLAGIRHIDGTLTWFPGAGAEQGGLIRQGDCGLIMRVPPDHGSGARQTFMPSITRHQWETLMDERSFRQRFALAAKAGEDLRAEALARVFQGSEVNIDALFQVALDTAKPCFNFGEGDQAYQFIHQFRAEGHGCGQIFTKISDITEQFKVHAGEDKAMYYGYCIAAKDIMEQASRPAVSSCMIQ